ncbi:DUF192 domain-containing protein [Trichormus sp. NMC-1]|uniref:DUF192 domain-containing protein n=1 Tax=Trichormus sp. NMC-1 TaxID=1853259 RepID=UPI0008DBFD65|nr:DUF192 domain-containing protein [Trichormus sp. NMC-1]
MFRWLSLFSIFLSVLLIGCSPPTAANPPTTTSDSQVQTLAYRGQNLPISALATIPNGTKIKLEVARTPKEQMMGLMYRPALPDDQGMLFVFPSAEPVSFWMKNVPVALDMVFMENGKVKYIQTAAPSCKSEPCPTYGPNVPINQVIELRAERATELGLQVGDKVKIEFLNPGASQ